MVTFSNQEKIISWVCQFKRASLPEKRLNDDREIISGFVFSFGHQIENLLIVFLDVQFDSGIVFSRGDVFAQISACDK